VERLVFSRDPERQKKGKPEVMRGGVPAHPSKKVGCKPPLLEPVGSAYTKNTGRDGKNYSARFAL